MKIYREEKDLRILHQLGMEGLVKPRAWDSSGSSGSEEEEAEEENQYQEEVGEPVKNEMISPHLLVKTEMPEEAQVGSLPHDNWFPWLFEPIAKKSLWLLYFV